MEVESNLTVHSASHQGQYGHTAAQAWFSEMLLIPYLQQPLRVEESWQVSEPSLSSVGLFSSFIVT